VSNARILDVCQPYPHVFIYHNGVGMSSSTVESSYALHPSFTFLGTFLMNAENKSTERSSITRNCSNFVTLFLAHIKEGRAALSLNLCSLMSVVLL
jgi:hypothetical protein